MPRLCLDVWNDVKVSSCGPHPAAYMHASVLTCSPALLVTPLPPPQAHDAEVRCIMCNTALLLQLKEILARGALPQPATPPPPTPAPTPASPPDAHSAAAVGEAFEVRCDSRLLQTALSVTASLALFPECSAHMAELKMLDEVVALAEHADPLVRLCGERALMSMYLSATAAAGGEN